MVGSAGTASVRRGSLAIVCLVTGLVSVVACHDVREFDGSWTGERVGDAPELRVGMADRVSATLVVQEASLRWFRARLTTDDDVFSDALIQPIAGAEADILGSVSFDGSPLRVFIAFVQTSDGAGTATCVVALYADGAAGADKRIEIRVMRGPSAPLYGIFRLTRA